MNYYFNSERIDCITFGGNGPQWDSLKYEMEEFECIIAISKGKYDSETVVNAVATACGILGLLCVGWPAVLFGVTGCVIGCVSFAVSLAHSLLIEIPMEDGGRIYVYIPANMDITA